MEVLKLGVLGVGGGNRALALWAELTRAVGLEPEEDGGRVAGALGAADVALMARVLPGVLDLVGVEPAAARLVPRLNEVLRRLEPELLTATFAELDLPGRRAFAADVRSHASAEALGALVLAAAPAYGSSISSPCREILLKLVAEAEHGREPLRARAQASLRELAQRVFERWSAGQLDAGVSRYDELFQRQDSRARTASRITPESRRVLQVALETGSVGAMVWTALREHLETETGIRLLLDLLKAAPEGRGRDTIAAQIATPGRLLALLAEDPVDWRAVDTLLPHLGAKAIRPLLDELVESDQRGARRELMNRLVGFGPEIQPMVVERLRDGRWYVVRNMLALLREAGCAVPRVPLEDFAQHADPRVRREVLQLRLEQPEQRDRAVAEALLDPDRQVLRVALQGARTGLSPVAAAMLARRLTDPAFPPEFRVLSLHLLGRSSEPAALEALLAFAQRGRTLLGRPKLAPATPEMLAALSGLARGWSREKRVRELLELARRSGDPQVQNALRVPAEPEGSERC